ncbi:hypothetical protein Tco_0937941 [Tanacetum coccineum]|uniref:Uncharacterized protein n=1 Tax=Tanacetum coccineum TaxID=301880 RepID=A0ABQ5DFQ1_9ASTR
MDISNTSYVHIYTISKADEPLAKRHSRKQGVSLKVLLTTGAQIAESLKWFQKQFPPNNSALNSSTLRTHASAALLVHIVTEQCTECFSNVGNTVLEERSKEMSLDADAEASSLMVD